MPYDQSNVLFGRTCKRIGKGNLGHLNFNKKEASNDVWLVVTCRQVESLDTDGQNFASSCACSYRCLEAEVAQIDPTAQITPP